MKLVLALSFFAVLALASAAEEGAYDYYNHKQYLGNYVQDDRGKYVPDHLKKARGSALNRFGPNFAPIQASQAAQSASAGGRSGDSSDSVVVDSAAATAGSAGGAYGSAGGAAHRFGSNFGAAAARDSQSPILRFDSEADTNGYHYAYQTGNQIAAEETGHFANKGRSNEAVAAHGFYQYVGPDGRTYRVDYTADENGFVASGDHLPKPPPIPEAIQRSLDYIRARSG